MKRTLTRPFMALLSMSIVLSACATAVAPANPPGAHEEQGVWPETATSAKYYDMPSSESSAMLGIDPMSLEELEEKSAYIVRGRTRNDSAEYLNYLEDGGLVSGFTYTTLDILEVYKGDLERGDSLTLAEDYYIRPSNNTKTFCHRENYYPSDVGRDYLFFLVALEVPETEVQFFPEIQTLYFPAGIIKGRYPALSSSARSAGVSELTNRQLNLGTDNSDQYRSLYQEVIDKYMTD